MNPAPHLKALDGLRGAGALIVVLWHLAASFFPAAAFGVMRPNSFSAELLFYNSPLWVLLSGSFAVCLFFVLSGYVLTADYFRRQDLKSIVRRMLIRFPRLALPASAFTFASWLLYRGYPDYFVDYARLVWRPTGSYELIAQYFNLSPDTSIGALAKNLFWLPWFQTPDFKRLYNGVLWTMYVELAGSFLVMSLAIVLAAIRLRWIAAAAFALCGCVIMFAIPGYGLYFAMLLVGGAIALFDPKHIDGFGCCRNLPLALLVAGMFLGGYNGAGLSKALSPLMFASNIVPSAVMLKGIGAILTFVGVISSKELSDFFSKDAFVFLGRISFSLYLCHPLIIGVVGIAIFSALGPLVPISARAIFAAVISLGASISLAIVAARFVDAPAISFSRNLALRLTAPMKDARG